MSAGEINFLLPSSHTIQEFLSENASMVQTICVFLGEGGSAPTGSVLWIVFVTSLG